MPKSKHRKKQKQKAKGRSLFLQNRKQARKNQMDKFLKHIQEQTKLNLEKRQQDEEE